MEVTRKEGPSQVQLHHDGGYHVKVHLGDSVQSFALGRVGLKKVVTCSGSTGGPMGTFGLEAWDCGKRKDCCVIANGKYVFEPSDKKNARFGEGKYDITFDSGIGFEGGRVEFSSRFIKPLGERWKGLYGLGPSKCEGMKFGSIPVKCPGQPGTLF